MPTASKVVTLVVALAVGGLVAAFLLPVGIGAVNGDQSFNHNFTATGAASETEIVTHLNVTLDSVTANTNATYTLNDTRTGSTDTVTVNEGANATATVGGQDITVILNDAGTSYADTTFEVPRDYSFSDSSRAMWAILGTMIVLAAFLTVVGLALREI